MPPILILSGCIITTNISVGSPYSEFKMDGFTEPSPVIANGLPALEVWEAWQRKPQSIMPRFVQCAIGLSGCLFLAIRLSASLPNVLIIQTDEHHF